MIKIVPAVVFLSFLLLYATVSCNQPANDGSKGGKEAGSTYDPKKGIGKYSSVNISANVDAAMSGEGEKLYGIKCSSCHKLTDEKLVGPGWEGVTNRHKPEWIMNFLTNTEEMLLKDPEVQQQLETCLVRMPNQGLADKDARALLEYMRKNDGAE